MNIIQTNNKQKVPGLIRARDLTFYFLCAIIIPLKVGENMSLCLNCGKYAHGNQYCYNCFQNIIKETLLQNNYSIPENNVCLKCNQTISQFGYCEKCYKKHIILKPNVVTEKIINTINNNTIYKKTSTKISKYNYNTHATITPKREINDYEKLINKINKDYQRNLKETKYIKTNTLNKICEICGAASYNMPFCNSCYNSFIKGNNNNFLEQFEDEKIYTCKSGIKVRSLSEREISDFLTEHKIEHQYEKELKYKFTNYYYNKEFIKSLHPDFYIKGPVLFKNKILSDIYLEFWGFDENSNNIKYLNTKNYKLKTYKEMGITLINLNKDDLNNVEESLTYKLLNYQKNTINY